MLFSDENLTDFILLYPEPLLASLIPGLGAGQLQGQPKATTSSSLGGTVGETLQSLLENGVGDFGSVVWYNVLTQRRRRECKSGGVINMHNLITLLYLKLQVSLIAFLPYT